MNGQMQEREKIGFVYTVEVVRAGRVIERETIHNLMPVVALNHALSVLVKNAAQAAGWYIGLYEGDYTPVATDTTANFPTDAVECTAYNEAARVAFTPGAVAAGAVDNSAARAEFTLSAEKTVYGGFIASVAAKGALTGTLLSAVKFGSAKQLDAGDVLRVTAGLTLTSA